MEINGKQIKGIYSYYEGATYSVGDFIIKGTTIYTVNKKVTGVDPDEDTNNTYYTVYLADQVASYDDLAGFYNGSSKDKYVSAELLGEVLNKTMMGFDDKGLITNSIKKVGDGYKIYMKNFFGEDSSDDTIYSDPLDQIITERDINNATFLVDGSLATLILGSKTESTCLLRQYTYKQDRGDYVRIQELIDLSTGYIAYRILTSSSNDTDSYTFQVTNSNAEWIIAAVDKSITGRVRNISRYYYNEKLKLENEREQLRNSYAFRLLKCETSTTNNTNGSTTNNSVVTILIKDMKNNTVSLDQEHSIITLLINKNSNPIQFKSITVDFSPLVLGTTAEMNIGTFGEEYIVAKLVKNTIDNKTINTIVLDLSHTSVSNSVYTTVSDAYCRYYYSQEDDAKDYNSRMIVVKDKAHETDDVNAYYIARYSVDNDNFVDYHKIASTSDCSIIEIIAGDNSRTAKSVMIDLSPLFNQGTIIQKPVGFKVTKDGVNSYDPYVKVESHATGGSIGMQCLKVTTRKPAVILGAINYENS